MKLKRALSPNIGASERIGTDTVHFVCTCIKFKESMVFYFCVLLKFWYVTAEYPATLKLLFEGNTHSDTPKNILVGTKSKKNTSLNMHCV